MVLWRERSAVSVILKEELQTTTTLGKRPETLYWISAIMFSSNNGSKKPPVQQVSLHQPETNKFQLIAVSGDGSSRSVTFPAKRCRKGIFLECPYLFTPSVSYLEFADSWACV